MRAKPNLRPALALRQSPNWHHPNSKAFTARAVMPAETFGSTNYSKTAPQTPLFALSSTNWRGFSLRLAARVFPMAGTESARIGPDARAPGLVYFSTGDTILLDPATFGGDFNRVVLDRKLQCVI